MGDCERPPAMCPGSQVLEWGGVTNTQTGYLLGHPASRGGLVSRLGDSKAAFLPLCAMPSPGSHALPWQPAPPQPHRIRKTTTFMEKWPHRAKSWV